MRDCVVTLNQRLRCTRVTQFLQRWAGVQCTSQNPRYIRGKREVNAIVRGLAEHQHGVVARRQLLARGARGARSNVGSPPATSELLSTAQTLIDVTIPGSTHARRQRGVRIHVTDRFHREDVDIVDGIAVTSIVRTVLDLAAILTPIQLRRAIEQADRDGVLNVLALERALARRPGAKGRAKLRAILEDYTGAPPTRSVFERVLLELIEKAGLPKPLVNAKLAGLEPDI